LEDEYTLILNDSIDAIPKLSEFLPKNYNDSNIKCLTLLTLSSWNPVITTRKINGNLKLILYLLIYNIFNHNIKFLYTKNNYYHHIFIYI